MKTWKNYVVETSIALCLSSSDREITQTVVGGLIVHVANLINARRRRLHQTSLTSSVLLHVRYIESLTRTTMKIPSLQKASLVPPLLEKLTAWTLPVALRTALLGTAGTSLAVIPLPNQEKVH